MGNSQKLFDIQHIFNLHTILIVKKLPFSNTEEAGIYTEVMDFFKTNAIISYFNIFLMCILYVYL